MELASREVQVRQGEAVYVLPLGDIQYAGEGSATALGELKRYIEWGCAQKHAFFIGMGDYIDFASPSNRARLRNADLYDTANNVIELSAEALTKELFNRALKPTVGKWAGMLEGHHFYQYQAGMTTDQELCSMLKTQHLGSCAYVRFVFKDLATKNQPTQRQGNVTFWVHHGAGSGQRAGSPLNKLDQLPIFWDADVYLMGHQSKKPHSPLQRIEPVWKGNGGPHLKHRTIHIAGTGSFSRAYMAGNRHGRVPRGDYVEKAMLNPAALGAIKVKIIPQWHGPGHERGWDPEITIEA